MKITGNHIKEFEKALKMDGIDPALFEDLHDTCDPNGYVYDILRIELNVGTIEIYNEFSENWDKYIAE